MGLNGNWDGRISRRALLRTGGSAAAGLVMLSRSAATARAVPPFTGDPFSLGVASGDPTANGIVLWTRLAPAPLDGGGLPPEVFGVRYELAADKDFRRIVRRGTVEALPEEVHTVHAEIGGLAPAHALLVPVQVGHVREPGRATRTAPAADAIAAPLRFAFVSCQNWSNGFYPAYADLAKQDARPRRPSRRLHLRRSRHRRRPRPRPRAGARAVLARRLPHAARAIQDRSGPAVRARRAPVPDDLGRPRVQGQLRRPRPRPRRARWRPPPRAAPRPISPIGSTRPCRGCASPSARTCRLTGALAGATLATFHVLDTRQYRSDQFVQCALAARSGPATARTRCSTRAGSSGPRSANGCSRAWRNRARAGTSLANQVASRRRTGSRAWPPVHRRQLGRLRRRPPARARLPCRAGDHEHGGDHRRRAYNSVRNVPPNFATSMATPSRPSSWHLDQQRGRPAEPADDVRGRLNNPHILFDNFQRGYGGSRSTRRDGRTIPRRGTTVAGSDDVPTTTLATFVRRERNARREPGRKRSVARVTRRLERRPDDPAQAREREAAASPPAPASVLDLQRSAGNAAVARVLAREPAADAPVQFSKPASVLGTNPFLNYQPPKLPADVEQAVDTWLTDQKSGIGIQIGRGATSMPEVIDQVRRHVRPPTMRTPRRSAGASRRSSARCRRRAASPISAARRPSRNRGSPTCSRSRPRA